MFYFLILFNFLFGFDDIKIIKHQDNLQFTNLTRNNDGVIMGRGSEIIEIGTTVLIYHLISRDNGFNFDTVSTFIHYVNPNYTANYIYSGISYKNKFIFNSDFATLLTSDDEGKTIDTIKLDVDEKYQVCKFKVSQNDTNLVLYSKYNINQTGYPKFDLYYSIDGFKKYKVIEFESYKDTFNILMDVKLENSTINLYSTLYVNNDSNYFNIYSYNLKDASYKKDSIKVDFFTFEHILTYNENHYLYIVKLKERVIGGNSINSKLLIKLNKSGYEVIDTLSVSVGGFSKISHIEGDIIYTLTGNKLSKYNIKNEVFESVSIPSDFFNSNDCPFSTTSSYSWYIKETNTLMLSSGSYCIYELDLDALLSVDKKDIKTKIYPNPASKGNIVNIELEELANKIEIYDLLGNKLQTINENNFNYQISIEGLKSGIYYVIIEYENKKQLTKFVVE